MHDDSDVITFYTPWDPPLLAIRALSAMFPENSFLLESGGEDAIPFKGGKNSTYWAQEEISGSEVKRIG